MEKTSNQRDKRIILTNARQEVSCLKEEIFNITSQELSPYPYLRGIAALNGVHQQKGIQQVIRGTAFFISPDLLLTCAHNLRNQIKEIDYTNIKIYPGAHGELQEHEQVEDYRLPDQYKKGKGYKYQYDYALLKLKKKSQKIMAQNILTLGTNFKDKNATLKIYGYPSQCYYRPCDSMSLCVCLQGLTKQKRIQSIDWSRCIMSYKISTASGHSGSPIVSLIQGKPICAAIHCGGDVQQEINFGRLISQDMLDNLNKWAIQMKGSPIKWRKETPYFKHFQVNGNILSRISVPDENSFQFYQAVFEHSRTKEKIYEISFRVVKYGEDYSFITFGLILSQREKIQNSGGEGKYHRNSVGYQTGASKHGSIFIDGEMVEFDKRIYMPVGQIFKMKVNRLLNTVQFTNVKQSEDLTLDLPKSFKGKEILPFISMSDQGDCVQIQLD